AVQGLRAYRPRRREHKALAEAHAAVQEINDHSLAFDALGDQIDTETAEQVGEIGGIDVACDGDPLEQDIGAPPDEPETPPEQLAPPAPQGRDRVQRETGAP